jgi:hypothetical protein
MADLKTVEAEAKAVAAETTSVLSSLLGTWNPRWPRFVETWRGWSLRKRIEAGIAVAIFCGGIWYFGLSVWHLGVGGYRSAYAYGHGNVVSLDDVKEQVKTDVDGAMKKAAFDAPTKSQFNNLEAKVHQIEVEMQTIEDRLSTPPAQITTGSITKKRRPAPVKSSASSWFSLP